MVGVGGDGEEGIPHGEGVGGLGGVWEQFQDVDAPQEVVEARRWLKDQEGPGGPRGGGLGEGDE